MVRERIVYLDILRILATVGVICIHSGLENIFTVELFIMISGAVWLSKSGAINLKRLYSQNILRIVTAFCFWSSFYAILHALILPHLGWPPLSVKETIVVLIQGRYHLWFCYLIVGIYIGLPFFKLISENECLLKYFLGVTYIFALVVPCLQNIPSLEWTSWMTGIINWGGFLYAFYFMTGYFLLKIQQREKKQVSCVIYLFGIVSVICRWFQVAGEFSVVFLCGRVLMIFLLCREISECCNIGRRICRIIGKGAEMCFGVYLIHDFYLTVYDCFIGKGFGLKTGEGIVRAAFAAVVSFGTVWLLRKVPVFRKYIC